MISLQMGVCLLWARKILNQMKTSKLLCISFDEVQVKELVVLPQKSYFILCLYFAL